LTHFIGLQPIGPVSREKVTFALEDNGIIDYFHQFLLKEEADELWEACKVGGNAALNWDQGVVTVGQRQVSEPRLTTFLGETDGLSYTYNAKANISVKWPPIVEVVKKRIEVASGQTYNVVLMNWYQDGSHHVGWHADSEDDLVKPSVIASLSLGATRPFQLRHKEDSKKGTDKSALHLRMRDDPNLELTDAEKAILTYQTGVDPNLNKEILCHHGDLLIMRGNLQEHWRHRVPQTSAPTDVGPRICFTFRSVLSL
jgi:alkylated DNA repair dioxygenase AlkB